MNKVGFETFFKDSCKGSGLYTPEISQGSHPSIKELGLAMLLQIFFQFVFFSFFSITFLIFFLFFFIFYFLIFLFLFFFLFFFLPFVFFFRFCFMTHGLPLRLPLSVTESTRERGGRFWPYTPMADKSLIDIDISGTSL